MLATLLLALVAAPEEPVMSLAPGAPPAVSSVAPVPAQAPAPVIVGGFERISARAPELRPVLDAAVARITPAHNARPKIIRAERQVVAGTNYRLLVKLRDGSRWRVIVWQRLDGTYEVTEAGRES